MLHKALPPVLEVVQEGLSKRVKGLGSACVHPKVFPAPRVHVFLIQIFFRHLLSSESKAQERRNERQCTQPHPRSDCLVHWQSSLCS
jgi:hypothetical protein